MRKITRINGFDSSLFTAEEMETGAMPPISYRLCTKHKFSLAYKLCFLVIF